MTYAFRCAEFALDNGTKDKFILDYCLNEIKKVFDEYEKDKLNYTTEDVRNLVILDIKYTNCIYKLNLIENNIIKK